MTQKLSAAAWSIGVNALLTAAKIFVALRTGSIGILAEVFHSGLDLAASLLAYVGIRKAQELPDATHHYGHHRFENLSALAQVLLIVATALFVAFESIERLTNPHPVAETSLGIAVILAGTIIALYTSHKLKDVADKEGSAALESDAFHFQTDVWAGAAVLLGLVFTHFGYPIADPLAALAVAALMLYAAAPLGKKALMVLTDAAPDARTIKAIEAVLRKDKRITSFHKLRARQSGSRIFVDVHLRLRRGTSIEKAHAASHLVKEELMAKVKGVEEVNIHLEPEPRRGS